MPSQELLAWATALGPIFCSWPTVVLLLLIAFRKPILNLFNQIVSGDIKKAKIGPVEIERELGKLAKEGQQAVENVNRLNTLMAESRILELKITEGMFGQMLTRDQQIEMRKQIDELSRLTKTLSAQTKSEIGSESVQGGDNTNEH